LAAELLDLLALKGDLDDVHCTRRELDFLLEGVHSALDVDLFPEDVLGSIAGCRPLVATASGDSTMDVKRDHSIRVGADWYRAAWDAANAVLVRHGAALSHHHGIGLLRAPYMKDGLGSAFPLLEKVETALDPHNLLNPGKLGLATRGQDCAKSGPGDCSGSITFCADR
jgi:hypothetical protein